MITFPNAKINLGLEVFDLRNDGYHNIQSLLYPIPFRDVLEISKAEKFALHIQSQEMESLDKDNLITQAYHLIQKDYGIPPINIHLIKNIPFGSGLGGGSSDASYTLMMLNEMFGLELKEEKLLEYALQIGSDCPFFLKNAPQFVKGRGEIMEAFNFILEGKWLLLALPKIQISTEDAFQKIEARKGKSRIQEIINQPISEWKGNLKNDFESLQSEKYDQIKEIIEQIDKKAEYTSLSGTGSAVYGLFSSKEDISLPCESIWLHLGS